MKYQTYNRDVFKCTFCTKYFSDFRYFIRHKSRHKRLYQYYGLLCTSKRMKSVCFVKKQQPEDNSIGCLLNPKIKGRLTSGNNFPKQNLESTVLIQTCSKRNLEDTVPEESCTKQKSQRSIQSDAKIYLTCLKCQRIFQTTESKECFRCNYCMSCVRGVLIPDQPVVSKDIEAIRKTNNDKSHVPSESFEVRAKMAGALDDSVIFESTDVATCSSDNSEASEATEVAGMSGNHVMSENSHARSKNITGNHVTFEKQHAAAKNMTGNHVTSEENYEADRSMSGNHVTSETSRVATLNHVTSSRPMAMKGYLCCSCNEIFKSNCDARFHRLVEHMTREKFECAKCNIYLCGTQMVADHEMMTFHCSLCGEDLPSSCDVISHWTKKQIGGIGSMKSERKFNFMSCEADRLYDKHGKASNHKLFCGVCKKIYENMCHPNWHNTKGVFSFHWCINCSEILWEYVDLVMHEIDQLHCAYCHRHFTSQEERMQHVKLRETVISDKTETGVDAGVMKQKNTSASGEVKNKSLKKMHALPSNLSMSGRNTVVNAPGTSLSSLPVLAANTPVKVVGALPLNLLFVIGNTTVDTPSTASSSLPMSAGNTALDSPGTLSSSLPVSARNTADNASGTLLPGLPVIADNTAVTATDAILEPFSVPMSDGNAAVNATGTLPSSLPAVAKNAKACKIVNVVKGHLPCSIPVTANNTAVTATGAILKPFSIPVSDGNTAVNVAGTLPFNLPAVAKNAKACKIVKVIKGHLPCSIPVTAENATNAILKPFSIPVSAGNTVVKACKIVKVVKTAATGAKHVPFSIPMSAGNTTVNATDAQSSSLHSKDGESANSAAGRPTLSFRVRVDDKTTKVPVSSAQISNTVNMASPLPSSLHGPTGGTKVNTTWASPSGL